MGKAKSKKPNTVQIYGSQGREDLLRFDPDVLVVVTEKGHVLYDSRAFEPLDEPMVLNIMVHGVIEPVIVRKAGERPDGKPIIEVVDGRRRVLHAREANRRRRLEGLPELLVPAKTTRGDEADLFATMVTLNQIRKDDSPAAVAEKMQRMVALVGDGPEGLRRVAVSFGCSLRTVRDTLKILECAPEVQEAIKKGEVPAAIAPKIARAPEPEQRRRLEKMRVEKATKGREAERIAAGKEKAVEEVKRIRGRHEIEAAIDGLEKMKRESVSSVLADAIEVLRWTLSDPESRWTPPGGRRSSKKSEE